MRYRALKPNPGRQWKGDPSYDPTVDEALRNEKEQDGTGLGGSISETPGPAQGFHAESPPVQGGEVVRRIASPEPQR